MYSLVCTGIVDNTGPPQSTPLDCVDNGERPLTHDPNKVCVTARTAKNTSTSPKLKTAEVKTTTEESDSQFPATLNVDELKSPSDMMWPSGPPQEHHDQVTSVNTSQTISSDLVRRPVEAHRDRGGNLSSHTRRDMRRIARSEWKKMFNKVSDILKDVRMYVCTYMCVCLSNHVFTVQHLVYPCCYKYVMYVRCMYH